MLYLIRMYSANIKVLVQISRNPSPGNVKGPAPKQNAREKVSGTCAKTKHTELLTYQYIPYLLWGSNN